MTHLRLTRKDIPMLHRYFKVFALINPEQIDKQLGAVFQNYQFMDQATRASLRNLYLKSYTFGTEIVHDDIFINTNHNTFHSLKDRFDDFPLIAENDADYLEKLVLSDKNALDELLEGSDIAGYQQDYSHEVYQNNFVDGIEELKSTIGDPTEELQLEPSKLNILIETAYSDGVEDQVDKLSYEAVSAWAEEQLEEE